MRCRTPWLTSTLVLLVFAAVRPLAAEDNTGHNGAMTDMPGMTSSQPMGDMKGMPAMNATPTCEHCATECLHEGPQH